MRDDGFAVDRVGQCPANASVSEYRVAKIQADVGKVDSWGLLHLQGLIAFELTHDVRGQVVDDQVDGALPKLETAHGVVGHDAEYQPGIRRGVSEVAVEALEGRSVVGSEPYDTVRARPYWLAGQLWGPTRRVRCP